MRIIMGSEEVIAGGPVTAEDISGVVEIASKGSAYASQNDMNRGFITTESGVRIGVCGDAVCDGGRIKCFREITSLNIRIPHEIRGIGIAAADFICDGGAPSSCLILSPPGGGKTTLLRDVIRTLSDARGIRVAVADERSEISMGMRCDLGTRTDVCSGCSKADASMMLIRSMCPEALAFDEITAPEDVSAAMFAAHCGVALIATAHASSAAEAVKRPLYRPLFRFSVFRKAVIIHRNGPVREYEMSLLDQ